MMEKKIPNSAALALDKVENHLSPFDQDDLDAGLQPA